MFFFQIVFIFKLSSFDSAWTETGVTDLKHLSERLTKHERSMIHMNNCVKLAMVGELAYTAGLGSLDRGKTTQRRGWQKSTYFIKLIDWIKFCGAFELAMQGHDERDKSKNTDISGVSRSDGFHWHCVGGTLEEFHRLQRYIKNSSKQTFRLYAGSAASKVKNRLSSHPGWLDNRHLHTLSACACATIYRRP